MNKKIFKLTRLAILLALSIVLSYFESFIPIPIPGVKLGLANIAALIVLYMFSMKEYVLLGFIRIVVVGMLRGSVTSFLFSFMGWMLSTIVVVLISLSKKCSIFGLSIASAIFHSIGQIIICMIIYESSMFVNYMPLLLITSIISGLLVALISSLVLRRLPKSLIESE